MSSDPRFLKTVESAGGARSFSSPKSWLNSSSGRMNVDVDSFFPGPRGYDAIEGSSRNRSVNVPTESSSPSLTVPSATCLPFRRTPLVEPLSRKVHSSSPLRTRIACLRETEKSFRTTSFSDDRPIEISSFSRV
jgi:hypothetical protein